MKTMQVSQMRLLAFLGLGISSQLASFSAFAQQVDYYAMNSVPWAVTSSDFNGDGLTDLATANGGLISILINDGVGSFEPPVEYGVESWVASIAVVDLDGDHDEDIVACNQSHLFVLLNHGDGTFDDAVSYSFTGNSESYITTGDFNLDGATDVAIVTKTPESPASAFWFENDGHGILGPIHTIDLGIYYNYYEDLIAGDFDDDGDIDLAMTAEHVDEGGYTIDNRIVFLFNVNLGESWTIQREIIPKSNDPFDHIRHMDAGDIDGDGDLDFVFKREDDPKGWQTGLLINNGNRFFDFGHVFNDSGEGLVQYADIDGDGDLDIVSTYINQYEYQCLSVLLNSYDGSSFRHVEIELGPEVYDSGALTTCDFSDDGLPDMVICRGRDHSGLWLVTNTYLPSRPVLEQSILVRGESAGFQVVNAAPDSPVYFLYSFSSPGNSRGIGYFGGLTLDLVDPIMLMGSSFADNSGTALLNRVVPAQAPLTTVTTQAVARMGVSGDSSQKTNFITAPIQP